ncbi:hypothetical protein HMPREF0372_01834 [Flavonifractor plautii ATCC 29863]|uniref:Uncharacterized protein n=1 Tax=Flavonifractor plautii ATCC 29863 TaxID=411475 RepID=G9YQP1_FLAPL|nr:hypothetical protein HMPREF0372_01834 [Flavonifractor plautii ATCC 29863]
MSICYNPLPIESIPFPVLFITIPAGFLEFLQVCAIIVLKH